MKIQSSVPIRPPVDHGQAQGPRTQQAEAPSADPAAKVDLSPEASFVQETRAQAEPSPFRQDLVDQVRQQLAEGTFEQSVNMDRVIDGLMASL